MNQHNKIETIWKPVTRPSQIWMIYAEEDSMNQCHEPRCEGAQIMTDESMRLLSGYRKEYFKALLDLLSFYERSDSFASLKLANK